MVDKEALHCPSDLRRRNSWKSLEERELAAETKWLRDLRNPDIVRRGSGTDTMLGVAGVARTEGDRVRESRREVTCTDTVHTKVQMADAMQSVSAHGISARALTGEAMGDFGVVFTTGAASSNGDGLLQLLPARSVSALPPSVVCDVATLEPPVGFSGAPATHHKKNTWSRSF